MPAGGGGMAAETSAGFAPTAGALGAAAAGAAGATGFTGTFSVGMADGVGAGGTKPEGGLVVCILTVCGAAIASRICCVLGLERATGVPATGLPATEAGGLAAGGFATGGVACVIMAGLVTGAILEVALSETFSRPWVRSLTGAAAGTAAGGLLATVGVGAVGAAVAAGPPFSALDGTGGTEPVGGFGTLTCTTCIGRVTFKLLGGGIARVGVSVCLTVTAGLAAPPAAPTFGGKLMRSVSFFISLSTPVLGFFVPSGNGGTFGEAGIGEVLRLSDPGAAGGVGSGESAILTR